MYIMPELIDMGLNEGQEWPTPDHRIVAQNLAIGNSVVTTRDQLTHIVQQIITVPVDRIMKITVTEVEEEYGLKGAV